MNTALARSRACKISISRIAAVCVGCALTWSAYADPFFFSTGNPDGLMATGSRPSGTGITEIESADDFVLSQTTRIDSVTFTGLLPRGFSLASIGQVRVEIYRVFPFDSINPPSGHVPTRVNSPSDIAFAERDSALSELSFTSSILSASFTAANSVLNGINPIPSQFTGGEGAVTGEEVLFTIDLAVPFVLAANHYFFVPQVQLTGTGNFLWLSAPKPIVAPGTPFAPDLQSWIRNQALDPDWLRVGTDITHQGPFNAAFSLSGATVSVPEPATLALIGAGFLGIGWRRRRARAL